MSYIFIMSKTWDFYHSKGLALLGQGEVRIAGECALKCKEIIFNDYRTGDGEVRLASLEQYKKTLKLLVECSLAHGCSGCAHKHLLGAYSAMAQIAKREYHFRELRQKALEVMAEFRRQIKSLCEREKLSFEFQIFKQKSRQDTSLLRLYS